MILRIWHPSKSCPECRSCRIHLAHSVSFFDQYQLWSCCDCEHRWLELNGILASEMKSSLD